MNTIGNIKANRVRIYKFNTCNTFFDKEEELYNNNQRKELNDVINSNNETRTIAKRHLNPSNEIALFENDVIRLALKDNIIKYGLQDLPLLDEIVYLKVYRNDIMKQIIDKGLDIEFSEEETKHYIFFSAPPGQVRKSTIILIEEDFYKRHEGFLLVGLTKKMINKKGGMNIGKYLAYTSLSLSSSIVPKHEIDIDRCLVVKGLETVVTDKVKYIDIREDEKGQNYVFDTPEEPQLKDIEIEHTDGAGMFMPNEIESSCQIRGGFFKGAMFPFDFRKFAKEVAHNTKIVDAWGEVEHDIETEDIRYIFTTSQLKTWKMYSSWEDYKKAFKENGLKITINNYANPPKDKVAFSYQYLQTLPYGCNIKNFVKSANEDLTKLHNDIEYVKNALGYTDEDDNDNEELDSYSNNKMIAKALSIYPPLIYENHIYSKIKSMVRAKKKAYKCGKFPINGYYSYVVPDMYAFCEYLFSGNNNPVGLIPKDQVYNKFYDMKGDVEHLICLRSPHLSNYEYGKRDLVKEKKYREKCREWFQYMESDTIVSCHDLLSKTLQNDWDGDEILVSNDANLWELAKGLPNIPLYYEMQKAKAQEINNEAIYKTLEAGFRNNVIGDSSNAMTKLWNTADATNDDPIPYDDAINVFCAYSNYAIDYPKTGKELELGKYQEQYNKLVPKKPFAKTETLLPQFMKDIKSKDKVADSNESVMNRIYKEVGKEVKRKYNYTVNGNKIEKFNYAMLMNNETDKKGKALYEVDREDNRYIELCKLLMIRKKQKKALCRNINEEHGKSLIDNEEIISKYDIFHYYCTMEIANIFTENGVFNEALAVNYFIDMEYKDREFVAGSKDILWKCFGHVLINNLQANIKKNSEEIINYRPRMIYRKSMEYDKKLDDYINKCLAKRTNIPITENDMEIINQYADNEHTEYRKIVFALYCIYKNAYLKKKEYEDKYKEEYEKLTNEQKEERDKQKEKQNSKRYQNRIFNQIRADDYFYLTWKKKPTEQKVTYNGKRVLKKIGVNEETFIDGIYNLQEKDFLIDGEIVETTKKDEEGKEVKKKEVDYIWFKFDIQNDKSEILFEVSDITNPMLYLEAYDKKKIQNITKCKICGNDFIKTRNAKTCSKKCSDILHDENVDNNNEKNRNKG